MVEDAQTVRDTILNSQPSESSRERARHEYEDSMNAIRMLAQEEFNRELRIEMSERKWALDVVGSNSPDVARQQQWILDNIRKADDNLSHTPFVNPDAPKNAEGVLSTSPQKQGDSKRASDESLEGGYGSARPGEEEELELELELEGEEGEGDIQPRQSRPPSRPNAPLTQPRHSRSPVSRRDAQSRQRRPSNFRSAVDYDDEGAGDSPAHPAQPLEGQPFSPAEPPRRQCSGSQVPVGSRVPRPSEPSGISRTFAHANGQMYSPSPVQFPRRGSVNSMCSDSSGSGLHRAGSLNSDQNRSSSVAPPPTQPRDRIVSNIGTRERQMSTSAGPHDRPSPSIYPTVAPRAIPGARPPPLDDAVRSQTFSSSGSRTLFSMQRSPEDMRQGIAIPRGPTTSEEGPRGASWSSLLSRRSYGDVNVHRRHNSQGDSRLSPVDGGLSDASDDVVGQLDDQQSVHITRRMHSMRNKEMEQMSIYWETEAHRKEGETTSKEEEATKKEDQARRHEEKARLSLEEAQRLEAHARLAEASVKIREAAVQKKEAEVNLRELEAKRREADLHGREKEFRLNVAEALRKEEEVTRREGNTRKREGEARRLEEMSQQSLRNALRLESDAREAETSAKMREAAAQKREAEVNIRELETKKREADLHGREEESRLKEAEALRKEEEVTRREGNTRKKEEEACRLEEVSQQSLKNAQHLESGAREAETSAKMREAAAQKREAEVMHEVAKVKKREAEAQMREAEAQTREAEAQTREAEALARETEGRRMEEARHRYGEVCRLEEKVRQSLEEAERLEAGARQAEVSAKMHEAVAQQKEAEAWRRESEAKKLEAEVQYREAEIRRREEEASKKEEEVHLLEERARRSLEEAERFDASIRRAEASSKMREAQPRHSLVPETGHHHDRQPHLSRHQAEPLTNGAKAETRDIEEQLREKERYLQIREAEIQKALRAVDERREAIILEEDSLRERLGAMGEQEENLRLREAALTQSMAIEGQRNGVDREADSVSLASTMANTPRVRANVCFSSKSIAELKDPGNYSNEG